MTIEKLKKEYIELKFMFDYTKLCVDNYKATFNNDEKLLEADRMWRIIYGTHINNIRKFEDFENYLKSLGIRPTGE